MEYATRHMPLADDAPPSYSYVHESRAKEVPTSLPPTLAPLRSEWPSQNPLSAYYQPGPSHLDTGDGMRLAGGGDSMDGVVVESTVPTPDRRGGSVVSMDDPDVRMAAEALGELRADFVSSPMHRSPPGQMSPPRRHDSMDTQEEPLLSLLTTSHPLISTAIGVPLSAYHTSKAYSPVFRSSAEYVERRFTPVVNTVGSVGRLTGVEGGVRWFLSGRRPSQHRPDDEMLAHKRRRVSPGETCEASAVADMQDGSAVRAQRGRGLSLTSDGVESLPAYDDARSPQYSLEPTGTGSTACVPRDEMGSASWQSRLVMSTSGLSIAMSEESLRSLRYCLSWLRWANDHLSGVIAALRDALNNYTSTDHSEHERMRLYNTIGELKQDVLKTLKEVVDIVSRYAGGALPENARALVRKHLTSLPQRFRLAQSSTMDGEKGETAQDSNTCNPDDYTTVVANRVVVLALEGLDMMAQVAGVLDGTIVSAEEWCERLGRGGHRGVAVRDAEKGTLCHDGEAPRAIETSPTTSLAEKASEPV